MQVSDLISYRQIKSQSKIEIAYFSVILGNFSHNVRGKIVHITQLRERKNLVQAEKFKFFQSLLEFAESSNC